MSVEYINRISFKKDGVYLSTKSSNDDRPYHSVRIDTLSQIYLTEGKEKAEVEIAHMFLDYCEARGSHQSVQKYKNVLRSDEFTEYNWDFCEKRNAIYDDFKKAHPDYDMRHGLIGDWKESLNALNKERDEKISQMLSDYEKRHSLAVER